MKRCLAAVAASAAVVALVVAGCGGGKEEKPKASGTSAAASSTTSAAATSSSAASSSATSTSGAPAGELPDPCTLLSDDEVKSLTGRAITQIDRDTSEPTSASRYCQWQQDGGQLMISLTRTSEDSFDTQKGVNTEIDDLGDDAYFADGHLYVLEKTLQLDVYTRGPSDDAAVQAEAKKVAETLLPKVQSYA